MILRTLAIWLIAALPAAAEGLMGREFSFKVVTFDDPAEILYESATHWARVGDAPELGLDPEGTDGLDLVPVIVDVSAAGVLLDYRNAEPAPFYKARFNGYVLDFNPGCPEVVGATLDPGATTMPIGNKRIRVEEGRLLVNVSDLSQTRDSRISISLTLSGCP